MVSPSTICISTTIPQYFNQSRIPGTLFAVWENLETPQRINDENDGGVDENDDNDDDT